MALDVLWLASPLLLTFGAMWLTGATYLDELTMTLSACYPVLGVYFVLKSRDCTRAQLLADQRLEHTNAMSWTYKNHLDTLLETPDHD